MGVEPLGEFTPRPATNVFDAGSRLGARDAPGVTDMLSLGKPISVVKPFRMGNGTAGKVSSIGPRGYSRQDPVVFEGSTGIGDFCQTPRPPPGWFTRLTPGPPAPPHFLSDNRRPPLNRSTPEVDSGGVSAPPPFP
jgi:hypothetical protein